MEGTHNDTNEKKKKNGGTQLSGELSTKVGGKTRDVQLVLVEIPKGVKCLGKKGGSSRLMGTKTRKKICRGP